VSAAGGALGTAGSKVAGDILGNEKLGKQIGTGGSAVVDLASGASSVADAVAVLQDGKASRSDKANAVLDGTAGVVTSGGSAASKIAQIAGNEELGSKIEKGAGAISGVATAGKDVVSAVDVFGKKDATTLDKVDAVAKATKSVGGAGASAIGTGMELAGHGERGAKVAKGGEVLGAGVDALTSVTGAIAAFQDDNATTSDKVEAGYKGTKGLVKAGVAGTKAVADLISDDNLKVRAGLVGDISGDAFGAIDSGFDAFKGARSAVQAVKEGNLKKAGKDGLGALGHGANVVKQGADLVGKVANSEAVKQGASQVSGVAGAVGGVAVSALSAVDNGVATFKDIQAARALSDGSDLGVATRKQVTEKSEGLARKYGIDPKQPGWEGAVEAEHARRKDQAMVQGEAAYQKFQADEAVAAFEGAKRVDDLRGYAKNQKIGGAIVKGIDTAGDIAGAVGTLTAAADGGATKTAGAVLKGTATVARVGQQLGERAENVSATVDAQDIMKGYDKQGFFGKTADKAGAALNKAGSFVADKAGAAWDKTKAFAQPGVDAVKSAGGYVADKAKAAGGYVADQASAAWDKTKAFAQPGVDAVKSAGGYVADKAKAAGGYVADKAQAAGGFVADKAKAAGGYVANKAEAAWDKTQAFVQPGVDAVKSAGGFVADKAKAAGGYVADKASAAGGFVADKAKAAGGYVADKASAAGGFVADKAKAAGGFVADKASAAGGFVADKATAAWEKTKSVASTVSDKVQSAAAPVLEKAQAAGAAVAVKSKEAGAYVAEKAGELKGKLKEVAAPIVSRVVDVAGKARASVTEQAGSALDGAKAFVKPGVDAVKAAGSAVADKAKAAGGYVADKASAAGGYVADKAKAVGGYVADKASAAGGYVADKAKVAGGYVADKAKVAGGYVADKASAAGGYVADKAKAVGGYVADKAGVVADKAAAVGGKVLDGGKALASKAGHAIADSALGKAASWLGGKASAAGSWVKDNVWETSDMKWARKTAAFLTPGSSDKAREATQAEFANDDKAKLLKDKDYKKYADVEARLGGSVKHRNVGEMLDFARGQKGSPADIANAKEILTTLGIDPAAPDAGAKLKSALAW
jgi:hypothetical protein